MAQHLKRWESPRSQGRNIKGKGGSARARQLRKQQQLLRKKLKNNQDSGKDHSVSFLIFLKGISFQIRANNRFNRSQGRAILPMIE